MARFDPSFVTVKQSSIVSQNGQFSNCSIIVSLIASIKNKKIVLELVDVEIVHRKWPNKRVLPKKLPLYAVKIVLDAPL